MNEEENKRYINLLGSIYGAYTKMDKLGTLVYETYSNSSIQNATELNILVDINSIIHQLYSSNDRVQYNSITDLSSGIINLCAHYRSYFRTIGVNTKFFLINSLNGCDIAKKIVPDYNSIFLGKAAITKTNRIITNNMSLLKVLCPYLPGIYYIESVQNFDVSVIMADIIERLGSSIPNLIISKDLIPLQLCALYPYTSYLRPSKSNKEDTSWMMPINEKEGFRDQFWERVCNIRRAVYSAKYSQASPVNFSLFLALTKIPERSLNGITVPSTALDFILKLVGSEDIKINSSQFMNDSDLIMKYPVAQIEARYKVLDVQYMLPFYRNSPDHKSVQFLDLEDSATVNNISAKYYTNNPLDLQRL